MWFSKDAKVKYLVYHTKTAVTIIYKINLAHITTIITENPKKIIKLSIQHNRKYQAQSCEKFSPIVGKIGTFLKHHGYCYTNSVNFYYAKASKRQQLITHISIVKESTIKCYKHTSFSQTHTLIFLGVINTIRSISQYKYQSNI